MDQFLTWDPKPDRSWMPPFKAIESSVPGIQVTELLPLCAAQMHRLAVIRSLAHEEVHEAEATELMHTGLEPRRRLGAPPLGTILSFELSGKDPRVPGFLTLDLPPLPESTVFGEDHVPIPLLSVANPVPNLRRSVDAERDRERTALLHEQNGEWGGLRPQGAVRTIEASGRAAERIMNTPFVKAFHVAAEPETLRAEYGPGFGEKCLLARRLVEAGCPFVGIGLAGGSPRTGRSAVTDLDRGLGTLVKDLATRGILEDVLVVCAAPYGRRPPIEGPSRGAGWSRGFSVVLAGGMIPGGTVHGDTGRDGVDCRDPVTVGDFLATIYSACGLDWEKDYVSEERRSLRYVPRGQPVQDLF